MSTEPNWLGFFENRERLYAAYYLDFAEQNARRDPEAYDRLEAESGNLLRVADWLGEHEEAEGILRLAEALWEESDFIRIRGFMQRGLPLLEQARKVAGQTGDVEAEFVWLEALANIHWSIGKPDLAQSLYEQALELAQASEKFRLKAQAQLGMGRVYMDLGYLDSATRWLQQALQGYRQIQDYAGEIETLITLGNLLSLQGDFAEAEIYLAQGLPLTQVHKDRRSEAALRYALGYVGTNAQDWPQAVHHYEAAVDIAQAIGDHYYEVRGLTALGEAWLALGNADRAITLLEEALTRQEVSDDILAKAFTHFYLAKAYHEVNHLEKALAQLQHVYPFHEVPILAGEAAEAAWLKAEIYLEKENVDLARAALQNVLDLAPDHRADLREVARRRLEAIERTTPENSCLTLISPL